MKRLLAVLCVCTILAGAAIAQKKLGGKAKKDEKPELKTNREKFSYGYGFNIGRNLKQGGIDVDLEIFRAGIRDALAGTKQRITDEEAQIAYTALEAENDKIQSAKNKKEGAEFLAANKKKKGVKVTKSGLQYLVLKAGDGAKPKATQTVRVHYRGKLLDGTEFDSSYKRGVPAEFSVKGVIAGWTEALQLMKVGAKWKLFIPSELAYKARGAGGDIGPHATLIFEIELIGIVK